MKAHLLYRDRDFDLKRKPLPWHETLIRDLDLTALFTVMAAGDKWIGEVVPKAVLASSTEIDTILYRQEILRDCLANATVVRAIYDLAVATIEAERREFLGGLARSPSSILYRSVELLEMLVGSLRQLRSITEEHAGAFDSEGFATLFDMLGKELGDDYFAEIDRHLTELRFRGGALASARLAEGNKGVEYVLRRPVAPSGAWTTRIFPSGPPAYSYQVPARDESGNRALWQLRDVAINQVANAVAQSADHILSFFAMLRTELAFHVGCLNLHDRLLAQGAPICFPRPFGLGERRHWAVGLYDVCLALILGRQVVGNELAADGKDLVVITGANQGGKSTFLRSIGLSQVMMQCGMFVAAEAFSANVCERIFTHYKREEDASMGSGKFDEELGRMSDIVDDLKPNSLVLFNESFSATNEREGSEVARQIVSALVECRVSVYFVTHQYEFAREFYARNLPEVLFLRAERQPDGMRTFKAKPGAPLQTSYGEDLYEEIFAGDDARPREAL